MFRGARASVLWSGFAFGVSAFVMMGWYVPQFTLTHTATIVDLQGWHSRDQTLAIIGGYSPAARHGYLVFLALDCVFPVAGSWFVIAVVGWALASFGRDQTALRWVYVFPVMAALSDLLENAFQTLLTLNYPNHASPLASFAWFFTSSKFVFLIGNYTVFGAALVAVAWKQLAGLKSSES